MYLTAHYVGLRCQCTRSALLTDAAVGNHVESKLLRELERIVQVGGITLHLRLLRPSRVEHS